MPIEMTDEIKRRFERIVEYKKMIVEYEKGFGILLAADIKESEAFAEWRDNIYDPDGIIYPFDVNHPSYHDYELRQTRYEKAREEWEKYKKEYFPYGFDEDGPII